MNTIRIQTQDLTGPALDWAVAKCEALTHSDYEPCIPRGNPAHRVGINCDSNSFEPWEPSADWSQGGPIIEREKIEWQWLPAPDKAHQYGARKPSLGGLNRTFCMDGPTVLVAAMRCFVASVLGDTVEVPEELK